MKIYELPDGICDKDRATFIGETDQQLDFESMLKFDNKYYRCSIQELENNSLYVRFVDYWIPRCDDDYSDDNLRCPFCGYEERDSFELSDEDDEYICPQCGSTLKYNRVVKMSYDIEVVEEKEPLEIKFKK